MRSFFRIEFLIGLFLFVGACDLGIRPVATRSSPNELSEVCTPGAALFGGGSGTSGDPYKICTRAHLSAIAGVHTSKHFKVLNDINLGGAASPWTPIAGYQVGTFDGNSKTISNLYIHGVIGTAVGFFADAGNSATIKNVNLTNVDIDTPTDQKVGALIGSQADATVRNCSSSGSVRGERSTGGLVGVLERGSIYSSRSTATMNGEGDNTGGLVGLSDPSGGSNTIDGSYATGSISQVNGFNYAGGFVGYAIDTTISDSYSTGAVDGSVYIGGFIGWISTGNIITDSYATGNVTCNGGYCGGFAGYIHTSNIDRTYATGNVSDPGSQYVGGYVGFARNPTLNDSYATGSVAGNSSVGGFAGIFDTGTITNTYSIGVVNGNADVGGHSGTVGGSTETGNYWDTQTSGQAISASGTGLTTAQMKNFNNFAGWDFATIWNGAGFGGSAAVYPFLR